MADISCAWGDDFALTPDGDLLLVDGDDMVQQLIVRRLFTAVNGYVFHSGYGAGLPQRIGRPATARNIRSIVLAQMALEPTVVRTPLPTVTVTQQPSGLFVVAITYTSAVTSKPVEISLEIPGN